MNTCSYKVHILIKLFINTSILSRQSLIIVNDYNSFSLICVRAVKFNNDLKTKLQINGY